MKIKIELNSKELSTLVGDTNDPIAYDFDINVYTESAGTKISKKQETLIFGSIFWALATMLPHSIIQSVFTKWNNIARMLQEKLKKGEKVTINTEVISKEE